MNKIEIWNYCTQSIQESLREKIPHCKRDKCDYEEPIKVNGRDIEIKCKHFYSVYFDKWDKFYTKHNLWRP